MVYDDDKLKGIPKQQKIKLVKRAISQLRRFNCTAVLNGQYLGWKRLIFTNYDGSPPSQLRCVDVIEKACDYFTYEPNFALGQ